MENFTPEEIRKEVIAFLSSHPNKKFPVSHLHKELEKRGNKVSYPALLHYIDMMFAYGDIKMLDYVTIKLVWVEKK